MNQRTYFITLVAFLMSLVALSIDAMLPALDDIRKSINIENPNNVQLIISTVFFGMAFGLMFYGPLSDAWGRKKPLYLGISLFTVGSIVSMVSSSLEVMLIGRFLQGFGSAACRVVSSAMIRDKFSGIEMGKVMSLIMVVFILVPALAPSMGQLILYFYSWRTIFALFIVLGFLAIILLRFTQEETLPIENRIPFSFKNLLDGILETGRTPVTRAFTLASGITFGAFVGYLSCVQQILQGQYGLGDKFSFYFGALALFIGFSSFINSKLVAKFKMEKISLFALLGIVTISLLFSIYIFMVGIEPPLWLFISFLGITFLFIGALFGNLSSLAIEPLGHIAGVANSVISSVQTLISVGIGGVIGQMYSGSVLPLVVSFGLLSFVSIMAIKLTLNTVSKREKI